MIIVDTCVWIDLLRNRNTPEASFLESQFKDAGSDVCLSHVIYFEVLRGIPLELERKRIQGFLEKFAFYDYLNAGFARLAAASLECRKRGLNLPRIGDWLILKTVLDHSLSLLTSDRDFHRIHKYVDFELINPIG